MSIASPSRGFGLFVCSYVSVCRDTEASRYGDHLTYPSPARCAALAFTRVMPSMAHAFNTYVTVPRLVVTRPAIKTIPVRF